MLGAVGLHQHLPRQFPATGAARNLHQQLERPLARAKVRDVQCEVGEDDAHERHVREMQALRNHLGADQYVELAGSKGGEACFDRAYIVAQSRARLLEGHAVTPHHVRAHLGADAEPEFAAGGLVAEDFEEIEFNNSPRE